MIKLIQHKVGSNELTSQFTKLNELKLIINKELIEKDMKRLDKELKVTRNKYNKHNIECLIVYLQKLLKNINDESILELCWSISKKDDLPFTYPLQLINEPLYSINMANYIEVDSNEKIIELDLTELCDIIAFEFMYKDLGETHDSIEELLHNCGIMGFEKADILLNFFNSNGDKIYELSKTMLIDDSPYKSPETKKIIDYFHTKEFKAKAYREVIEYSCRYASTIIMNSIIKNALQNGIGIKALMCNATTIALIANISNEVDINKQLLEEITIRVFGRRFTVEPKISIL